MITKQDILELGWKESSHGFPDSTTTYYELGNSIMMRIGNYVAVSKNQNVVIDCKIVDKKDLQEQMDWVGIK